MDRTRITLRGGAVWGSGREDAGNTTVVASTADVCGFGVSPRVRPEARTPLQLLKEEDSS
jgi:hypothetical protein